MWTSKIKELPVSLDCQFLQLRPGYGLQDVDSEDGRRQIDKAQFSQVLGEANGRQHQVRHVGLAVMKSSQAKHFKGSRRLGQDHFECGLEGEGLGPAEIRSPQRGPSVEAAEGQDLEFGQCFEYGPQFGMVEAEIPETIDGQAGGQVLGPLQDDIVQDTWGELPDLHGVPASHELQVSPQSLVAAGMVPSLGNTHGPAEVVQR